MPDRTTTFFELISEHLIEIGAGRPRTVNMNGHDLPILRVADVLDGRVEYTLQNHTPNKDVQGEGSKVSRPGDIVLTTKGTVGRVALMPPDGPTFAYSPQLCFFRPSASGPLRSRFLYYWFKSAEFWIQANALKGQTDMADFLSLGDLQRMQIGIPSLDRQDAVVGVLGALDDKIAVNDRIAACALALADAHFIVTVEGLTPGPETFGSVAQVSGGGTPSTKVPEYWDGSIAWTTPSDVTSLKAPYLFDTSRKIADAGLDNCASALYPAGSIFMTSRATIGAFAIPQVPAAVNQGFIVVSTPDKELTMWLFHEMRDRVDEMRSLANGSTFLELSRKNFKVMGVRLPAPDVISTFAEKAIPLHQKAAAASAENSTLIELRDTLLPELMSGRLRVKDAEKVVENAV
ncbi:restriction endonuclease subunit S [Micromonospora sp. NPDC048999]|uniref:restriction endonuclease subunit S n=1 Tax=Micromonospora sp. NPDC048999 TaxID=3155391 RepID=UPI0033EE0A97